MLNILNGDCALEGWQGAGMPGRVLVWRENYLLGMIPKTADLAEFRRVRAIELHKIAPELTESEIGAMLAAMESELLGLRTDDAVTLWFDVCPFDRTMLSRLLFLLNAMKERPEVSLVLQDVVWDAEAFKKYRDAGRLLTPGDLAYGAREWERYCVEGSPETLLETLVAQNHAPRLHHD